ncbi:hypothetical protein JCM10450v2_000330 [Rhodotorula kratochvilovae]
MRVLLATLALALSAYSTNTALSDIGGLAGAIDNAAQAASLQSAAAPPETGSYIFRNAATGQALSYSRDGNHIVPSSGAGTPVHVLSFGAAAPWVRLQIGDKDKCLSAQWGGSFNLAGVMYSCAVDEGGAVTRAANTLEPTKQWWLMVPVSDYAGDSTSSTHVLLAAQAHSVATRRFARVKRGLDVAETQWPEPAVKPVRFVWWELVARIRAAREEKERLAQEVTERAAAKVATAAAEVKAAQVGDEAAAPVPASSAEPAVAPVPAQKEKSEESVEAYSPTDLNIKLNVAQVGGGRDASNKFFIIPVDHLIDMHTLALTGHEIKSFRAQSTALDLWDPTDEYQHWIVERA